MKTGLKRTLREVAKPKRTTGAIHWFPCHLKKNPHYKCRVYVSRRNREAKRPLVIHVRTLGYSWTRAWTQM